MAGSTLHTKLLLLVFFLVHACGATGAKTEEPNNQLVVTPSKDTSNVDSSGQTIQSRFLPPDGFVRKEYSQNSFAHYLQHLPLKPVGAKVYHFDGTEKYNQSAQAAVVDIDVGERDLQQCADAVIRLRAEYLWSQDAYTDISFDFTNGFPAAYQRWRAGERIRVRGNTVSWVGGSNADTSYRSFRKYLNMVFAYAGTLSLARELKPKAILEIEVGDVFIQGGSPGHAVIVVDKVEHPHDQTICVLLAQSYMPAQDIHVLNNPRSDDPWYRIHADKDRIITPEWTFYKGDLKSF